VFPDSSGCEQDIKKLYSSGLQRLDLQRCFTSSVQHISYEPRPGKNWI